MADGSFRYLDHALLADDRGANLPRILEALLDATRHVACYAHGIEVVDLIGFDGDAQLPAGLYRVRPLDAREGVRDLLQGFEALDVGAHRLTPRAGAGRRDSIAGRDDEVLDGDGFHVGVVGGNGVDHPIALAQALADVGADDRMRALHLVVDGLAYIMQQ